MKAEWHWFRYEYATRGSIHCHGLAKLKDDPGLVELTQIFLSKQKLEEDLIEQDPTKKELEDSVEKDLKAEK